ncbi:phage tail tube protein [Streptomyces sp. SGAir0957]
MAAGGQRRHDRDTGLETLPGNHGVPARAEPNIEDSSDYDSDGWAGNTKTGQSWESASRSTGRPTTR